jgi:hypothetical protein
MAAFCACCGAEIGPKAEACAACGAPQHGMVPKIAKENGNDATSQKRDEDLRRGRCALI